ncbi:MAG: DUF2878 domain-containing protein [Gemmatimonadales bacterium]
MAPPWILVLWLQFGTVLRHALRWLRSRPLAALLGAVGGPLSFRAGEALGAVDFGDHRLRSLAALAAVWAFAMPLMITWARAGSDQQPQASPAQGPEAASE